MTEMAPYHKISGPFKRHIDGPNRNKLILGEWSWDVFEATANLSWIFKEKVDGTNIRIHWDGHKVTFGGRTDKAQLPGQLRIHLEETFKEELFEQAFQETAVTLYGEGFGGKIQGLSALYGKEQRFVLFDVKIGNWWLRWDDVMGIAQNLGITHVPAPLEGTLQHAIDWVTRGFHSYYNDSELPQSEQVLAEGLVGVLKTGLLDRSGQRIVVKVKTVDFHKVTYLPE